jgi:hypothetical protein
LLCYSMLRTCFIVDNPQNCAKDCSSASPLLRSAIASGTGRRVTPVEVSRQSLARAASTTQEIRGRATCL